MPGVAGFAPERPANVLGRSLVDPMTMRTFDRGYL
jgi:hypothetical protein